MICLTKRISNTSKKSGVLVYILMYEQLGISGNGYYSFLRGEILWNGGSDCIYRWGRYFHVL